MLRYLRICLLAAASAVCTTFSPSAQSSDPAWPFQQPGIDTLRASPHKVFAHYFTPFMLWRNFVPTGCNPAPYYCTDNGQTDLYTLWLTTVGGYAPVGGYLRERPLPAPYTPATDANWEMHNAEAEIQRAVAVGLDGFSLDILSDYGDTPADDWHRDKVIMQAATAVDPDGTGHTGFKIMIMPDMTMSWSADPNRLAAAVATLAAYPSALRVPSCKNVYGQAATNCVVVAPFNAQSQAPAWWSSWLQKMQGMGITVAFLPVFQSWWNYVMPAEGYTPLSYGVSDWGTASYAQQSKWTGNAAVAKSLGVPLWMGAVRSQDNRPKDLTPPIYLESGGDLALRVTWYNAIVGNFDWVQIVTWNDYSEHTEISPSSRTQYAFYDLTAYYTTWFKTGVQPPVTQDVLYYFHRRHATSAAPSMVKTANLFYLDNAGGTDMPMDDIRVLGFLTSAGTVQVSANGRVLATQAFTVPPGGGIVGMTVPLPQTQTAETLSFSLVRSGRVVTSVTSPSPVCGQIAYQDLLYQSGSSTRAPVRNTATGCGTY